MSVATTAVVVDLDGTLRDTRHRQHLVDRSRPGGPDWDGYSVACCADLPVPGMVRLVQVLAEKHLIMLASGAQDAGWDNTVAWLDRYEVPYSGLLMRTPKERGIPNPKLKATWVRDRLLPHFDIVLAIDDHPLVIEALAELGIPGLLVASDGIQGTYDHLGDAHGFVTDLMEKRTRP